MVGCQWLGGVRYNAQFGQVPIALRAAYVLARGVLNFVGGNCVFCCYIINSTKTWKRLKPLKIVFRGLASVVDIC